MSEDKKAGQVNGDDEKKTRKHASKLWVPFVLLLGAVIGIATYLYLFYISPLVIIVGSQTSFRGAFLPGRFEFLEFHIILSTISIALLVALLVLYGRTYVATKANFILGLIIVLFALLLQNLTQYPLLHAFVDNTVLEAVTFSSPVSDVFTIVAYTVFLYLSLE